MLRRMDFQAGVTLLELLLVVTLLGILGAIAVPSYRNYAQRANERAALADIGSLQLELYRWELNTGSFPETLAEAGLDGRLDPWGRTYRYLNIATATPGQVRKDRNLVPINTDFDLYSTGQDGASQPPLTAQASRDDIVRANNG
ncbi:MAG: prepilin-type N-terminal cleavage/methylation domain-containing protein, partial [Gammaproteobacteria bacterium]|nr:prepilin-type N-terminal cleavage/methylation domain-containing protein [Gammaproteobacteria bacterium]